MIPETEDGKKLILVTDRYHQHVFTVLAGTMEASADGILFLSDDEDSEGFVATFSKDNWGAAVEIDRLAGVYPITELEAVAADLSASATEDEASDLGDIGPDDGDDFEG